MFRLTGTKKFRRYFTPFQFPIFRYHFFPSFKYISPIKIKNFNQRRFTNLPPTQSLFDPISYASCFIFSLLFYKLCSVSGPSVGSGIHYRYLALLDPCVQGRGRGRGKTVSIKLSRNLQVGPIDASRPRSATIKLARRVQCLGQNRQRNYRRAINAS